jgi:hypothetical protein
MDVRAGSGVSPSFSWQPVAKATRYLVVVVDSAQPAVMWSWSGSTANVSYGSTAIDGVPGSEQATWSVSLRASGYTWSVIALDQLGRIVGVKLRVAL